MKNIFYFFLPLLLLAIGCDESSDNDIVIKEGNKLTINASQTEASFTFTAPDAWSLHTDATDWLTPDILEGVAGTHTVSLAVTANTAETSRTAEPPHHPARHGRSHPATVIRWKTHQNSDHKRYRRWRNHLYRIRIQ